MLASPVDRESARCPGEDGAVEAAAGRELPLGFGGELFPGPVGIRFGVLVSDVPDGVALATLDFAAGTGGPAPTRAGHVDAAGGDKPAGSTVQNFSPT